MNNRKNNELPDAGMLSGGISRRKFFGLAGGVAAAGALLASCKPSDNNTVVTPPTSSITLATGDLGILNYAYAMEQLQAAFYIEVMKRQYSGMTAIEREYFTDIRGHEVAHREFFKKALGASAIVDLRFNFEAVNFSDRTSVLTNALKIEDLVVSGYNGAGKLFVNANYLLVAGKIVSVEARHAGLMSALLNDGTFAGAAQIVEGQDISRDPWDVLSRLKPYIVNNIDASNLPTS